MASLLDLQLRFAEALASGDGRPLDALVVSRGFSTRERLGVYRNNHVSTLLHALELAYPVLREQLGADDFHALAVDYVGAVPSTSGNLNDYGDELAARMAAHAVVTGRQFLCDVARLEWARQAVYLAPEPGSLDLTQLAGVAPEDHGALCFEISPAARLVRCDWQVTPLLGDPAERDASFEPSPRSEDVLVLRRGEDIELLPLAPAAFRCLDALAAGRRLADALDAAADDDFDLGAFLQQHVALGTLVGVGRPATGREETGA